MQKRVHRGGSFLCTDQYCARYMAGGRGKGELDTGTNHLGFRCVRDPESKTGEICRRASRQVGERIPEGNASRVRSGLAVRVAGIKVLKTETAEKASCCTFAKTSTASTGLLTNMTCNSDRCFIRIGIEATIRASANSTWIGFECTVTALNTAPNHQPRGHRSHSAASKYQAMPTKISHPADRHVP